ncbi:ATP-binding protein [Vibrio aquaticus]|uniref:ATP-binding protein n=1 Tax=Vibrio aquaticus TaxID=2496559 RepID=A0A432D0K5_9VIBR|nr:ATP-binding protein [Vibrio aquaticus]RTZ17473.1 ATP-binding protein [Vibrio aquaticus]
MTRKLTNDIDKIAYFENNMYPDEWVLTNLKQINCFIGPNNSGKSRQLRELFTSDPSRWIIDTYSFPAVDVLRTAQRAIKSSSTINNNITRNVDYVVIGKVAPAIDKLIKSEQPRPTTKLGEFIYPEVINTRSSNSAPHKLNDILILGLHKDKTTEIDNYNNLTSINWAKCYVPTLRSLRSLEAHIENATDLFKYRTQGDYFSDKKNLGDIFTGYSLYQDLVKHLLGSHEQRKKVRKYEEYLSHNFFFGQDISLVPMVGKDVVYFKEGDKDERPIYDLGDGIQSIIILTFPIFMADKPTIFFIEEPEHYLHAGLQRTLIEAFAKHEEHMFFMTTHSNHILDIAQERDDISIQHVHQDNGTTIVNPTQEYSDLLDQLGVRASSVLLANCSIWVEGITDKLYLRAYLNKYIQELRNKGELSTANRLNSYHENLHYVFTEYQGSNITHWAFGDEATTTQTPAKKLNKNILLIADADIDGKGNRTTELKEALGDSFLLLKWKEIENFIPQAILLETAKQRWDTFNQRGGCSIKRFSNIEDARFEKTDEGIGSILERFVDKAPGLERNFYKDRSGTIKDKVKFCHTAVKVMEEQEWELTPKLRELCKRIWDHIEKNNS